MKWMGLLAFLALQLFSSCALSPHASKTNLMFMDTKAFDQDLSQAMSDTPEMITISMRGNVSVNNIPSRLNNWLKAITISEGRLEVDPPTKSVALIIAIATALPSIYTWIKNKVTYRGSNHYNAKIYYDSETGNINKIVFHKKEIKK
ncbi:MAG: hypothetical protein KAH77_11500 [Thiomargarita sp.]|nr:hypothetical protein [Thiomargarita sp.]